jgi:hypothetical protein
MSSIIRSTRSKLRRKLVLPVTVIRRDGQEKQLAHTLDITEVSARLGGLYTLLEPGEVIQIQRGAVEVKFQVFWMGAQGSAMEGQAGVRSLEPGKDIWGINLPVDETDTTKSPAVLRKDSFLARLEGRPATEKRWHTRFECNGGASVRAEGSGYPMHGQVKDIAQGGAYVETLTPITVNREVYVKMNLEGVPIESSGVVRTSYPMVGMGVSFQNMSPENQQKLDRIIQAIRNRLTAPKNATEPAFPSDEPRLGPPSLELGAYPVAMVAIACRKLAADFDSWKIDRSPAELDELRMAIDELQQKLALSPQMELIDFFSTPAPQRGRA